MSTYQLLGQTVEIPDATIRLQDLYYEGHELEARARSAFMEKFEGCLNEEIFTLVRGNSKAIIDTYVNKPLFEKLADCGIYEISEKQYIDECLSISNIEAVLDALLSSLAGVMDTVESSGRYRELRKAYRGRVVGGGFGLKGAVKGMASAAVINAATGLAHSAANAVGNARDKASAEKAINSILHSDQLRNSMYQAITEDAHAAVVAHIKLVNKFVPEYFSSVLNGDKANGLLENAKRYPDKAQELLVRAFESNPYNQDILKRVFLDYPTERLSVLRIAPDFRINLTNEVQQAITDEYSGKAKENWEAAQEAKKNILSLMKAANLTENQTLNQLEHDGLSRLCEKLSPESDEAYCTFLLHQIESFDAQEKIKKEFIDKVQKRIEDIWSAEDGEMFDNLYMGTDLLDEKSIKKAIAFIEEKGRTDSSQKYLDALKKCNRKNLKIARFYQSNKLLVNIAAALGFLLIIAAVFFGKRLGLIGWYRWLVVLVGIVIILITRRITHTWDVLTIKGEAVHEFVKDGIPLDRESKG